MKKILLFFGALSLLIACEGPEGIPGQDGVNITGAVFEFKGTFTQGNNYALTYTFPTTVEILPSDVVAVYVLAGQEEGTDIWEPLPQTLFINDAILFTGFDYTQFDVKVFLDGNADLSTLETKYTNDKIFRAAVIPADLINAVDITDLSHVMTTLQMQNSQVQHLYIQ